MPTDREMLEKCQEALTAIQAAGLAKETMKKFGYHPPYGIDARHALAAYMSRELREHLQKPA